MYSDLIGLIVRDINRRKFSSFLTLFAISLGILSIFLITLVSIGFEQSVEQQFEQFGSNRLYVAESFSGASATEGLTDNDIRLIESRTYVEKVYSYYIRSSQVEYSNDFKSKATYGIPMGEEFFEDTNINLQTGRIPKSNERFAVVIGPQLAEDGFDKEIRVGSNLYIRDTKLKVVGILESVGNPEDDSAIYVNIDTLRDLFDAGDDVGVADVIIVEGENITLAAQNLQLFLDNRLGEEVVEVTSPEQLLEQVGSILGIIQMTLGSIAVITLIVGAFGIINTMYVIVTEKTKEIGIMKSIGATNNNILFLFVFQAGIFGFLGGILGIIFGGLLAFALEALAKGAGYTFLSIPFDVIVAFELLIFSFVVGVIAGYLPAREASKLNIIESIRR